MQGGASDREPSGFRSVKPTVRSTEAFLASVTGSEASEVLSGSGSSFLGAESQSSSPPDNQDIGVEII
jgi:hypothetical protein